jgi:hypothetical protein
MIQDRRGKENHTALISFGIPKLVRFEKSHPTAFDGINIPVADCCWSWLACPGHRR